MKILLDENLDWRLERDLAGHDVASVPKIGWSGITNGELIARAEDHFDVLITMDARFAHPRSLAERQIAVVILHARSNRLADTRMLMNKVLTLLESIAPGAVVDVFL